MRRWTRSSGPHEAAFPLQQRGGRTSLGNGRRRARDERAAGRPVGRSRGRLGRRQLCRVPRTWTEVRLPRKMAPTVPIRAPLVTRIRCPGQCYRVSTADRLHAGEHLVAVASLFAYPALSLRGAGQARTSRVRTCAGTPSAPVRFRAALFLAQIMVDCGIPSRQPSARLRNSRDAHPQSVRRRRRGNDAPRPTPCTAADALDALTVLCFHTYLSEVKGKPRWQARRVNWTRLVMCRHAPARPRRLIRDEQASVPRASG